jgi:hypothetical protein
VTYGDVGAVDLKEMPLAIAKQITNPEIFASILFFSLSDDVVFRPKNRKSHQRTGKGKDRNFYLKV